MIRKRAPEVVLGAIAGVMPVAGAAGLRLSLRVAGPIALLAASLLSLAAAAGAARAAPTPVWAECSPAPTSCDGWYRRPVTVRWWHPTATGFDPGTCVWRRLAFDTKGSTQRCTAWSDSRESGATEAVAVIRIDATPPAVVGALPDRPPDHAGWFNRPLTVTFAGRDATSGVAGCDSVPFAGPEGAGVPVSGSCRDRAGNVGTRAFPVNYDATPPRRPRVRAVPGNRRVKLALALADDAVSVEVTRTGPGADRVLLRGRKRALTDRRLRNGRRYRYRVTAIDRAGNRASTRASAVPTTSRLLTPAAGEVVTEPPELVWRSVRRAGYYNVQLFRGRRKVLSRWPQANRLQLRQTWRWGGEQRRLVPGRYVWYVWPGFGPRERREYGRALGKRSFVVRAPRARAPR